jgi:hypothetical protein
MRNGNKRERPTAVEPMFSTREVALRLGVGVDWVRKAFSRRRGVVRLSGRNMRIPESVLLALMKEHGYGSTGNKAKRARDAARP